MIEFELSPKYSFSAVLSQAEAEATVCVEFREDHLTLPSRLNNQRLASIRYSKIHSIIRIRCRFFEAVVVGAVRSLPRCIRRVDLLDAESIEGLHAELMRRAAAGENGSRRLWRLEQRELLFHRLCKPPWFTLALVGLFAWVFWQVDAQSDSSQFGERVLFGAFVEGLVTAGEIHRLVTPNFLHKSWAHLVNNSLGLIFFGWLVEAAIGAKRTLLLLFLAGTSGYSLLLLPWGLGEEFPVFEAAGSSAWVWGLLGASVVLTTRGRGDLPVGFRTPLLVWIVAASQLYFQRDVPALSVVPHLGGGLVGLSTMVYLTRDKPGLPLPGSPRLTPLVVWVASIALVAGGLAIRNDRLFGNHAYFALVHERLASPGASDVSRNTYSWILAITNSAPEQSMQLALEVMEDIVARDPKTAYRDTLATLYYRTGKPQRALEIIQSIWWEAPDWWTGSQLARFYRAALHARSTEIAETAELLAPVAEFAEIHAILSEGSSSVDFEISLAETDVDNLIVHALLYTADELQGLLEVNVDRVLQDKRCRYPSEVLRGLDPDQLFIRPVWYGTVDPGTESLANSCRLKWMHPDVKRIP